MSDTAYRLIGIVVWRALRWYVRELMPSRRRVIVSSVLTLAVVGTVAALLRRASA
jgi:hypothetical protein